MTVKPCRAGEMGAIDRLINAGDVVETGPDGSASVAFADECPARKPLYIS